jgi:hypothetical protein
MRLVPCTPPTEPLDTAPTTALLREADVAAEWDGFWSRSSDAYYARHTMHDGRTEWYRMDDVINRDTEPAASVVVPPRVLPFRGDAMRRVALVVAASPGGRQMLVGSTKRTPRQ